MCMVNDFVIHTKNVLWYISQTGKWSSISNQKMVEFTYSYTRRRILGLIEGALPLFLLSPTILKNLRITFQFFYMKQPFIILE